MCHCFEEARFEEARFEEAVFAGTGPHCLACAKQWHTMFAGQAPPLRRKPCWTPQWSYLLPTAYKFFSVRKKICPWLMAGDAKQRSPNSFLATRSNFGPGRTIVVTPSSERKCTSPSAETSDAL